MSDATPGCYEAYSAKLRAFWPFIRSNAVYGDKQLVAPNPVFDARGKPRLRRRLVNGYWQWVCYDKLPDGRFLPSTLADTPLEAYERWLRKFQWRPES